MKYLILNEDFNRLVLTEEAAKTLKPELSFTEANEFYDSNRTDTDLIDYFEKNGRENTLYNENASIIEVKETEDFTHRISHDLNCNDFPCEYLEQVPIIRMNKLEGKTPAEILDYLRSIDVLFVEG